MSWAQHLELAVGFTAGVVGMDMEGDTAEVVMDMEVATDTESLAVMAVVAMVVAVMVDTDADKHVRPSI